MRKHIFMLVLLLPLLASCDKVFEYHPNQIRLEAGEKGLTSKSLAMLQQQQPGDTIRFIAMGDTQRFYDEVVDFVKAANKLQGIDFVVHQGDISDFGMTQEFRWVHDIMKQLQAPYFTVIGNHDLLANGHKVYRRMYGALNYAFVYGKAKFIFLDTNGREYGFDGKVPDVGWLQKELVPEPEADWNQAVIISHVPPFSGDFDATLALPYHKALTDSKLVQLSLHGHDHNWRTVTSRDSLVTYHVTTTVKDKAFSYIKLWKGGYNIEKIYY